MCISGVRAHTKTHTHRRAHTCTSTDWMWPVCCCCEDVIGVCAYDVWHTSKSRYKSIGERERERKKKNEIFLSSFECRSLHSIICLLAYSGIFHFIFLIHCILIHRRIHMSHTKHIESDIFAFCDWTIQRWCIWDYASSTRVWAKEEKSCRETKRKECHVV